MAKGLSYDQSSELAAEVIGFLANLGINVKPVDNEDQYDKLVELIYHKGNRADDNMRYELRKVFSNLTGDLPALARNRVESTPELAEHKEFILADWPEGDEHWHWVATAEVEEILDWVAAGK